MKKKVLAVVLAAAMVFTMAACGSSSSSSSSAAASASAESAAAEEASASAEASAPAEESTEDMPSVNWKVSMSNDEANFMSIAWKNWGDAITEATDGRVEFTWYWSNTLIDSNSGWDQLLAGIADIADVHRYANTGQPFSEKWKSLTAGVPKEAVIDLSYKLWDNFDAIRDEFKDVQVLAQGYNGGTVYNILTVNKKVETVADMKGLVIWCEADWNSFLTECGATPVNTPWSEVYSSLQKNMYDGLMIANETLKSCMFAEVCKYVTEVDIAYTMGPGELENLDSWNSISAADQETVLSFASQVEQEQYDEFQKSETTALEWAQEEYGTEIVYPTDEAEAEFKQCLLDANLKDAADLDAQGIPASDIVNQLAEWSAEWEG